MNRHTSEDRVEFLHLETLRRVFAIFSGDVTACARLAGLFVLCALHNHLNSVTFLCHCIFLNRAANVIRIY